MCRVGTSHEWESDGFTFCQDCTLYAKKLVQLLHYIIQCQNLSIYYYLTISTVYLCVKRCILSPLMQPQPKTQVWRILYFLYHEKTSFSNKLKNKEVEIKKIHACMHTLAVDRLLFVEFDLIDIIIFWNYIPFTENLMIIVVQFTSCNHYRK